MLISPALFKEIKTSAENIHQFIYSNIKLSDQENATFIAGALSALFHPTFRKTYKENYLDDTNSFIQNVMNAISYGISKCEGFDKPIAQKIVLAEFSFIERNQQLKNIINIDGRNWIIIQYLFSILEESIFNIAIKYPKFDILGTFYDQFTKYSTSDQQSLGIVLTPPHVALFMSDLLELNNQDVVLDTCCGSSSLLLTAGGKAKQCIGVELNSRMVAISLANMIIKKLPTYLWLGNSFDEEIKTEIREYHPTKLIINPPYSQQDKELSFVLNGLDLLEKDGIGVVILPVGAASRREVIPIKKKILEKHTLLAIFTMPENLFYPVSTFTEILVFKAHIPHNEKTFIANVKDDGLEVVKNQGRQDTLNKWPAIRDNLFKLYKNHESSKLTTYVEVNAESDWTSDAFLSDEVNLNSRDFIRVIRNYVFFTRNSFNNGNTQDYIDYLLDMIDEDPHINDKKEDTNIKLEFEHFQPFNFSDIFEMTRGTGCKATEAKNNPGNNRYIGASNENNGITQRTDLPNKTEKNTITVANNGSVGAAFYQNEDYQASSDVTILKLKNKELNPAIGLFLCTMIRIAGKPFNYGRKWGISRMKDTTILLPVDDNNNINWNYMEKYINSLPYSKYI